MSTHSISPKGTIEVISPGEGPQRPLRLIHFYGRGDTGAITGGAFRAGENPVAIVDLGSGKAVTTSFNTTVSNGIINLTDTGNGGVFAGTFANRDLIAVTTDTGTGGL